MHSQRRALTDPLGATDPADRCAKGSSQLLGHWPAYAITSDVRMQWLDIFALTQRSASIRSRATPRLTRPACGTSCKGPGTADGARLSGGGEGHARCGAFHPRCVNRARSPVGSIAAAAHSARTPLSSITLAHLAASPSIKVLKSSGDLLLTEIAPPLRIRA